MNAMWPPDKLVEKQSRSKPTTFKQFHVKCIICVDFNSIYINRFIIFKNCLSQRLELFFYVNLKLTSIQFVFGHDKNKLLNLLEQVNIAGVLLGISRILVTARSWTLWRSVCTQKWLPWSPATIGDLSSCCNCSRIFDCLALVRIPVCRQHYPPYTL